MLTKGTAETEKPWLVIVPTYGFRSLRLAELWEFRDLLLALGMRDVKVVYKQTFLGFAWVLLQPLIGALIFSFVFGIVAQIPAAGSPYFVFAFAGMLGWTLFSATLSGASLAMINNSHLVTKIYFPRIILPLASVFQPITNFIVGSVFFMFIAWGSGVVAGSHLMLLPISTLLLLALGLGLGLCSCSIMVRYRDLRFVIPVLLQFLLYASPVGYSLAALDTRVPESLRFIYLLNPLATLLELFRWTLFGKADLEAIWCAYSIVTTLGILMAGGLMFRRSERDMSDVI